MEYFARQIRFFPSNSSEFILVLYAEKKGGSSLGFLLHRQNDEVDAAEMLRLAAKTEEGAQIEIHEFLKNPELRLDEWERTSCLSLVVSSECTPGPWTKFNLPPCISFEEKRAVLDMEVDALLELRIAS